MKTSKLILAFIILIVLSSCNVQYYKTYPITFKIPPSSYDIRIAMIRDSINYHNLGTLTDEKILREFNSAYEKSLIKSDSTKN